jgi:hypothetical protein
MAYLYINGNVTASQEKSPGWKGVAGNEYLGRSTYIFPGDNPTGLNGLLFYMQLFKTQLSDFERRSIEAGAYGNYGSG